MFLNPHSHWDEISVSVMLLFAEMMKTSLVNILCKK